MSIPPDDMVRDAPPTVNEFWDNLTWDELHLAEQDLWSIVGYSTADLYNGVESPPEEDMDWADLQPEQQDALTLLGYTEDLWNNGDYKPKPREKLVARKNPLVVTSFTVGMMFRGFQEMLDGDAECISNVTGTMYFTIMALKVNSKESESSIYKT